MKILDCTLRDGGYYTNWDFDQELVDEYAGSMEKLPIDYVEVGYRSIPLNGYLGKYFYCPIFVLKELKELMPSKKLVIILNEKDIRTEHVNDLLKPIMPYVTLVRIAVDPKNMERAIELAKSIKVLGFEVAFNVMYMSDWRKDASFLDLLEGVDDFLDYFYMVDSFGGILPNEVKEIIRLVKSKTKVTLGFHGHDNLQMGLINTITALDEGCEIVDATITGMGRGAGNLKTELLLTYLESKNQLNFKFNYLSNVVSIFEKLNEKYRWGTSLPYMYSGAHSLPQKQVMEWVGMNRYPLSSILTALNNKKLVVEDNIKLPILGKTTRFKDAIIIGGGKSVNENLESILTFVNKRRDTCLIHAGVRHVPKFLKAQIDQFYALVGFESEKLTKSLGNLKSLTKTCIFPPYPRKMGTIITNEILNNSIELSSINFTESSLDSPFAVSIQAALDFGVQNIYLIGFDGYKTTVNENQLNLAQENQNILDDLIKVSNVNSVCLTSSNYKNISSTSIHSFL
ncbi:aldolase catalytic domain-containing protein [Algibacter sp.]|nr:aldolase catalytic domain-containing protein [Algibacter sp.]